MTQSIFEQYPIANEKVQTSAGEQPTPYHVYDGHLTLIGGSANYDAVATLLNHEQVFVVKTESGRALMALYVANETKASHGPHTELQVAFYVSHQPTAPAKDGPFAPVHLLISDPQARQMCYGLWNNSEKTVAYNREILGLAPKLATSRLSRLNGRFSFAFHDEENGRLLARGNVGENARQPPGAALALFRSFGLRQAMRSASMKIVDVKVVNPINEWLPRNADAQTYSTSDSLVTQRFDPDHDQLEFAADLPFGQVDFVPTFVQHMRGFKMVYRNPE